MLLSVTTGTDLSRIQKKIERLLETLDKGMLETDFNMTMISMLKELKRPD